MVWLLLFCIRKLQKEDKVLAVLTIMYATRYVCNKILNFKINKIPKVFKWGKDTFLYNIVRVENMDTDKGKCQAIDWIGVLTLGNCKECRMRRIRFRLVVSHSANQHRHSKENVIHVEYVG